MKRICAFLLCLAMCLAFAGCGPKATVESFAAELRPSVEQADDTGALTLQARENALVYSYKYKIDLGADTATVAAALEASLAGKEATYTDVLAQLKTKVKSAEAVVVEFLDKDGKLIYTKTFQ